MKFKTLMVIKAVVCFIFGIPLVLVPGTLISILGATLGPGGTLTSREYGAALMGNLMLCWFARNVEKSVARKAIVIALFVYDLIGFVATLKAMLVGVLNPLGWFIVFVYFFFTVGFGYFLFAKK